MDTDDVVTAVELQDLADVQQQIIPDDDIILDGDGVPVSGETVDRWADMPDSYKKNSEKEEEAVEKAANYLCQLMLEFPERPEPVLIVHNECEVKKLICTFIRPTAIAYPELGTWQGIANFTSDHTVFQPLLAPTKQQDSAADSENAIINEAIGEEIKIKYQVRPRRKFESKYIQSVERQEENEIKKELALKIEEERKRIEEEEKLPDDELEGQRVHYWVLVLPENCRSDVQEPFFIEAASGKPFSISDPNYHGIEYVWNNEDFWFHRLGKGANLNFDFEDSEIWFGLRSLYGLNYDLPLSWMERIDISLQDYHRRFQGKKKEILYLRSRLLKYSEYSRPDGLVMELINYSDLNWEDPLNSFLEFKHREDFLEKSEHDVKNCVVKDFYHSGRKDYIREHTYSPTSVAEREVLFYGKCHPLSLEKLILSSDRITEEFQANAGECCILKRNMKFLLNSKNDFVVEWTEEFFSADINLPSGSQIAQRKFFHLENRVFLKFHRNPEQLTAGYLHFLKPSTPSGNVDVFHVYKPFKGDLQKVSDRDFNDIFSKHIAEELKIISHAQGLHAEIKSLIQNLNKEREHPGLNISPFNDERNSDTVSQMKLREQTLFEYSMSELLDPIDYTAPLLAKSGSTELISDDDLEKIKDESLKKREEDDFSSRKLIKTEIELLTIELDKKTASEQKNQLLETEREEIKKMRLKIDALKFRHGRQKF